MITATTTVQESDMSKVVGKKLYIFCFVREPHEPHTWDFNGRVRRCTGEGEEELKPQTFEFCGSEQKHRGHLYGDDIMCWGEPHRKESDTS